MCKKYAQKFVDVSKARENLAGYFLNAKKKESEYNLKVINKK